MTIAFTPRKESLSSIVYARQKADGKAYCYFSTPIFCQTLEELLDHAECNHDLVKSMKVKARSAGQFANALMKHASDLRIHSQAILRRAGEMPCYDYNLYKKVKAQTERTYKLKT